MSPKADTSNIPSHMRAAVLYGPNDLKLEERPVPEPGPGEVLLRVEGNTLCGTDGRIFRGEKTVGITPGIILGHEFGGTVAAVGPGVENYRVGDQASVYPIVSCGSCAQCVAGRDNVCETGRLFGNAIDGGLAEFCLIPELAVQRGNLIQTDTVLPPKALSLMEPVSACLHGFNQYGVDPGDTVVIFGAGPIGLIHLQLAKAAGATQVIVSNRSPVRRNLAESMGATRTVDPTAESVREVTRELTNGRGADVSVVCVGVPELANQALEVVRVGGRVNYFAGFPKGSLAEIDVNLIHYNELLVTGGSGATLNEAAQAARLLEEGIVDAESLASDSYPLADVEEAFTALLRRDGFKIMVTPQT